MSVTPGDAPVRPAYLRDAAGLYYKIGGGGSGGDGTPEVYAQDVAPGAGAAAIIWIDTDDTSISSGGSGGGGGGLQSRTTASVTTASLAAGASEQGMITLAAGYRLYSITTSAPARVRLYTTVTKQAADLARAVGTDPTGDHGVVLEFVSTSGLLSADLSPTVDGFDGKTTPDGAIPVTITNTGASPTAVTVDFTYLRTE